MKQDPLRQLLTTRRSAIEPETHGLTRPTGQGRRAAGLSQHQVDHLTDRAINTYQRLESGNYLNPPLDYLRDIAVLFDMNEHEWIALHRYARGEDPPGPLSQDSGYHVAGAWQHAVNSIGEMAYLTDASWNVLAANAEWAGLFPSGRTPDNTMRWMLLSAEARHVLTDWKTAWAPLILPQLRVALATRQDDTLRAIERDVLADPVTRSLYDEQGVYVHPNGDQRPIHHAVHGPGWVTMCSAQPEGSTGSRLMILLYQPGARRPRPQTPLRACPPGPRTPTRP
ncbi:helix-turn-helix transcriptional regulator [Streptomyces sp. NRRL F-5135]|uniref:MmyB family transcriptional regulator n=1 Tax=Streptomyces sp. NRRL F-5135 TaxID=1463858 RepID=UPI00068E7D2F|nr:helix-turn-helix transcriptional regulator [Streptomyces sp. NRRL F-5135]